MNKKYTIHRLPQSQLISRQFDILAQFFSPFLSAGSKAADKFMLNFTNCGLVPKQLTDLSAALEPADKKGLKNWAIMSEERKRENS
jgi:hypothetical protein